MKEEVEKIIGMDYKKLQIASIVQQGQLNAIIDLGATERQELINNIIGIDKLDIASKYMLENIKKFREKIKTDLPDLAVTLFLSLNTYPAVTLTSS